MATPKPAEAEQVPDSAPAGANAPKEAPKLRVERTRTGGRVLRVIDRRTRHQITVSEATYAGSPDSFTPTGTAALDAAGNPLAPKYVEPKGA